MKGVFHRFLFSMSTMCSKRKSQKYLSEDHSKQLLALWVFQHSEEEQWTHSQCHMQLPQIQIPHKLTLPKTKEIKPILSWQQDFLSSTKVTMISFLLLPIALWGWKMKRQNTQAIRDPPQKKKKKSLAIRNKIHWLTMVYPLSSFDPNLDLEYLVLSWQLINYFFCMCVFQEIIKVP